MFNKKDDSAELAASMESHLVTHVIEKQAEQMNKFAKALDYLNSVAEIFDELGLTKEAEATTTFMEVIAKKKSKKKSKTKSKPKVKSKRRSSKKKDPATEGLTSEKMVGNLKEKGWVFNADDDFSFSDDTHHDSCMCMDCMDASDFLNDDDDNYHFDTDEDASYRVDRNDIDEDDRQLRRMFHDLENEDDFEDETHRQTMRETPVAKRHERPTIPSEWMQHLKGGPKLRHF